MERLLRPIKPECDTGLTYSISIPNGIKRKLLPIFDIFQKNEKFFTHGQPVFVLFGSGNRTVVTDTFPQSLVASDLRLLNLTLPSNASHEKSKLSAHSNLDLLTFVEFFLLLQRVYPQAEMSTSRCDELRKLLTLSSGGTHIDVHSYFNQSGENTDLVNLATQQSRFLADKVVIAYYPNEEFKAHDPYNLLRRKAPSSEEYRRILGGVLTIDLGKNPNPYYRVKKTLEIILCNPHFFSGNCTFLLDSIIPHLLNIDRPPTYQESLSICALFHKRFIYPDFFPSLIRILQQTPLGKILNMAATTAVNEELQKYFQFLGI